MSPAAQRLLYRADSGQISLKDLAHIVQSDAALAACLLRLANSSFFGLSRQVRTLSEAIVLVGWKGVRNLVVSASLHAFSAKVPAGPWIQEKTKAINHHCLATAIAARRIGVLMKTKEEDELFLAGLIHDLGRVVLMLAWPDEYRKIWEIAERDHGDLTSLERDRLGIDHVRALEIVCQDWKLPTTLIELVTSHHPALGSQRPSWPTASITFLQAGNALAKVACLGDSGDPHIEIEPFCHLFHLGWSTDRLTQETQRLVREVRELQEILGQSTADVSDSNPAHILDFFRITAQSCGLDGVCSIGAAS